MSEPCIRADCPAGGLACLGECFGPAGTPDTWAQMVAALRADRDRLVQGIERLADGLEAGPLAVNGPHVATRLRALLPSPSGNATTGTDWFAVARQLRGAVVQANGFVPDTLNRDGDDYLYDAKRWTEKALDAYDTAARSAMPGDATEPEAEETSDG